MNYSEVLFSFQGRIPRSTLWLKFHVPWMLGYLVSWFLDVKLGTSFQPGNVGVIYLLFALATTYPFLAVDVKRAHDRGRSGWFILLLFIPLLNIWPVIELWFLRGTMGPNQYGPDSAAGPAPNGDQAAGLAEQAMTRRSDWKPLAVLVVLLLVVVGFVLWRYLPSGKSGKETAATPTVKTPAATATVPKTSAPKASTSAPDQPKTPTTAKAPPIAKPPSTAAEYLDKGWQEKDPQKKIELYTKAIDLDPKSARAFNNRGFAYYIKKDYDQALKDYDQAIALKPGYAVAYNNRGDAYYQRKEYDRAQADFSKAIGLKPDYGLAYFNRGNAFFRKREFDLAINDYNKAVEVEPNWAVAYSSRGSAWFEKKEFDQALKDYDQAIAKNPNYAWAYYRRAVIYNQKGDGEQARQNYAKAKALDPNLPELAINERLPWWTN